MHSIESRPSLFRGKWPTHRAKAARRHYDRRRIAAAAQTRRDAGKGWQA